MANINLTTSITTKPDFSGFKFYVEAGKLFWANDYAEAYNINEHDINMDDIKAAQDKAAGLNDGEWMLVEHDS